MGKRLLAILSVIALFAGCSDKISEVPCDGYVTVNQKKGLNWSGVISDARTEKYRVRK